MIKNTVFFFNTRNYSNDDPFISCSKRIEKNVAEHRSEYLQWLFHSGERVVAVGLLFCIVLNIESLKCAVISKELVCKY